MTEADAAVHDVEGGRLSDRLLTRIQLWTRASSYSQDRVAPDGVRRIRRIADLSSIATSTRSLLPPPPPPPPCLHANARNRAQDTNPINVANGQATRISARFPDRFERIRALSAKYGLDLAEADWTRHSKNPVQRVERPIRMRIRYWCHHCNTPYGISRVCAQCSHERCNRCVRHPPRRTAPRVRMADAAHTSTALSGDDVHGRAITEAASSAASQYIAMSAMPPVYTNGGHDSVPRTQASAVSQDFVQHSTRAEPSDRAHRRIIKRSRVRVHHICHECQKPFTSGEWACSGCGHERCIDCPRDPPRRRQPDTRGGTRDVEHPELAMGSGSDEADEVKNQLVPDGPPATTQGARDADRVASPSCASHLIASMNTGGLDVALPKPPLPV